MTRSIAALVLGCAIPLLAGCGAEPAPGAEFVAANSSTVVIDYTRGSQPGLDAARQMAADKCALFGSGKGAVLESLNVVASGRERASFLCKS